MSETTYHIENSPSGRATCKKCKEKIAKGELRICISARKEGNDMNFNSYHHPKCFNVPPRAFKGVSPSDFVELHLDDQTNDNILSDPTKKEEIIAAIALKLTAKRKSAEGGAGGGGGETTAIGKRIEEIKKVMESLPEDDDESDSEEDRPTKKAKKSVGNNTEMFAKAMKVYGKMKVDDLKNVIRWNLGYGVTGTRPILMLRCIDGHVNGRLGRCPTCFKGKLQLKDEDAGATIICKGYYDEEAAIRIPCGLDMSATSAPRLQPWYSEEPTEEEMEAMKAITEKHEAMASGGGGGGHVPQVLIDAADKLDWDTSNPKVAAQVMLEVCTSGSTKVDLPQDEKKARQAIGKIILGARENDATAVETLELIVKEYGIASEKQEAKAIQKSAMENSCACAANAGIVQAFQELGDLYFKEGNGNAGGTYKKAITTLTALDYEITSDNAKGLGKGKTKVAGIGKGSADKIYEFLTTGTIQKLEEKRAIHS